MKTTATYLTVFASLAARVLGSGIYSRSDSTCDVTISSTVKAQLLSYHNDARKIANADPVVWSDDLYCSAQQWANRCEFVHSKTSESGENIGCGYGNGYEPLTALKDWWEENSLYNWGDGFSEAAGHYTQMVWQNTTEVGCGVAKCTASQMGMSKGGKTPSDFVVCQYKAPGNVQGYFKKFVDLPQTSRDPTATGRLALPTSTGNSGTSRKSHWSPHTKGTASGNSSSSNSNKAVESTNYSVTTPSPSVTKHISNNQHSQSSNHSGSNGKSDDFDKQLNDEINRLRGKQHQQQQHQGVKNAEDCKEGSKSGTNKDGGHWSYKWKTWSSSSKRSSEVNAKVDSTEPLVARKESLHDDFIKREVLSSLSHKRLHKRRRAAHH